MLSKNSEQGSRQVEVKSAVPLLSTQPGTPEAPVMLSSPGNGQRDRFDGSKTQIRDHTLGPGDVTFGLDSVHSGLDFRDTSSEESSSSVNKNLEELKEKVNATGKQPGYPDPTLQPSAQTSKLDFKHGETSHAKHTNFARQDESGNYSNVDQEKAIMLARKRVTFAANSNPINPSVEIFSRSHSGFNNASLDSQYNSSSIAAKRTLIERFGSKPNARVANGPNIPPLDFDKLVSSNPISAESQATGGPDSIFLPPFGIRYV